MKDLLRNLPSGNLGVAGPMANCPAKEQMPMKKHQLELTWQRDPRARQPKASPRKQRRFQMAHFWFDQMRQAVNGAFDRAPATKPPPEQTYFQIVRTNVR